MYKKPSFHVFNRGNSMVYYSRLDSLSFACLIVLFLNNFLWYDNLLPVYLNEGLRLWSQCLSGFWFDSRIMVAPHIMNKPCLSRSLCLSWGCSAIHFLHGISAGNFTISCIGFFLLVLFFILDFSPVVVTVWCCQYCVFCQVNLTVASIRNYGQQSILLLSMHATYPQVC